MWHFFSDTLWAHTQKHYLFLCFYLSFVDFYQCFLIVHFIPRTLGQKTEKVVERSNNTCLGHPTGTQVEPILYLFTF